MIFTLHFEELNGLSRSRILPSVADHYCGMYYYYMTGMGSSRISAARALVNLWRAVPTCRDISCAPNCSRSNSLVPSESVDVVLGNSQSQRHVHQLRTFAIGSLTVDEENVLSMHTTFLQHLNKPAKHGTLLATPGTITSIWGRQLVRTISSQSSKRVAHDEDSQVKDGDVEEDDVLLDGVDGGESASVLSQQEIDRRNSEREVLWRRLENCMRAGQAVAQIQLHINSGHDFSKEDSVILISKLRRYSRYLQAAEISDWIVETKMFPWSAYDQVVRLSLKGKLGLSSEVEKIFNDSPAELQTEIAFNAVIKHFCEKGMVKKANEWLERLIKSGWITHAFAFNRLLVLYKDKNFEQKIGDVLEAMNAAGISKDIYTYNILMSVRGKHNDVAGIEKVFEECKADPNVTMDPATYATLAGAYINAGLTEKAVAALEEGERLDFERTGNVDEVIATLWGKLENKERVLRLWDMMKQKDIVAARTYVVMIETFGRLGLVDQAEMLYEEMERTKGRVRPRQFTALLSAYANNNMSDKADTLIARIGSMELKRNATLNHHIVNAYLKMGKLDKALAVVSEAKWKGGFPVWFTTMVVLLNAVAETGDVMIAEKIFDNIRATYNQKNLAVFNILLKAYAKAGLPAEGFLERMAAARIRPNKETQDLLQLCSLKNTPISVHANENVPTTVAPLSL